MPTRRRNEDTAFFERQILSFLAGKLLQVPDGFFQALAILNGLSHAHADDDFFQLGQRVGVLPAQLFSEGRNDPLGVFFLQPSHDANQMC